jgi:hypothetical protein
MKDDKEHIDQLFESLNDRQFDIPEAFLEDLNKRLDNEPKRRKFFFLWFLTPLALIGAIGIAYFQYTHKSEMKPAVNQVNKLIAKNESKEKSETQNEISLKEQNQNNSYSVDSISMPSPSQDLSTAKQTQVKKRLFKSGKKEKNQKSSNQVSVSQRTFKTKNDQIQQSSKKLENTTEKSHSKISVGKRTKNPSQQGKAKGKLQKSDNVQTSKSKTKDKNLPNANNNKAIPDEIKPASSLAATGNTSPIIKENKEEPSKESVPEVKKDSTLTQGTIDTLQQTNSGQVKKDDTKPKPPAKNWKKEMVLFAGLGGNSIQDSPKNSAYLAKINQNQTSILTPSFGVNANLSYKKFTFGTGINYEQTGEKFKVDLKNSVLKDSTYSELIQDTIWVQDTSGILIPILHDTTLYYTVQYTDTSLVSQSFQNRYSWISIPLHFGYRFELGNYELIPRIGAVFNFGIAQKGGGYPNASFNNTVQYPPAKFNISYLIQLEARRNFDKWFVFINPYFQSMINPAVSGDVIRRRYTSWGMQFGVGFKL